MGVCIIVGDIHLGHGISLGKVGIGSNLNSRIKDQLDLLDWALDQAIELFADNIIITGDCFEEPKPSPALITLFISWLKKCQANSVNVHLIMGNHDMLRSGFTYSSPLDIISEAEIDGIYVHKNINTIIIDNTAITLVPFRDRKSFNVTSNAEALTLLQDVLVYELASMPLNFKKILIGHLAIEGSIPIGNEIDDIANELFCPTKMFNGYDFVWMGHIHKPQIMKKGIPYVAHIGSMDVSNFGETDHKKHIIIFDTVSKVSLPNSKNLPTRSLKKISIIIPSDATDTTQFVIDYINDMNDDLNKSIVKVEVFLSAPELQSIKKSIIEKFLIEKGVFSVNAIIENKKTILIKKDQLNVLDTKIDVSSAIKKYSVAYIDAGMQDSFMELAMEIYNIYRLETK
jgi:DNA repair exonuclease SbcCD nuclease subunit